MEVILKRLSDEITKKSHKNLQGILTEFSIEIFSAVTWEDHLRMMRYGVRFSIIILIIHLLQVDF